MKPVHKVLFVTPILCHPPKSGPELRIENSIKALSSIANVTLYCRKPLAGIGGDAAISYLQQFAGSIHFAPYCQGKPGSFMERVRNLCLSLFLRRNFRQVESEVDFQDVIAVAETCGADIIWLGYGNISYPLLKYLKQHSSLPVVLDTDSVWSRFVLRGMPFTENENDRRRIEAEGRAKEEEECWGTGIADVTTAVSDEDADYYRSLASRTEQVHVFPNAIDIDLYRPASAPDGFEVPCIYLAGSFWPGSPMEDAARWMLDHVLPLVKKELSVFHFYIVGKGSDTVLADVDDDMVTVTGALPSVIPYLSNASVAVVPLRFESGTRFKILEAGACGIPVVSTTLGAEGIPVVHGRDILIADDPESFSSAIVRLVRDRDLAAEIGQNLHQLVKTDFSIAALASAGEKILHSLAARAYRDDSLKRNLETIQAGNDVSR